MSKYTIGVDVGGTNVKLGLVSPSGKILTRAYVSTKKYLRSKVKLIGAITDCIDELITSQKISRKSILGIGIGLPGLINPTKGVVVQLPNIPGWRNVPLKSLIQKKLRLPVFIDNDVNVITLAEWKVGAGKGYKNLLCMTLGTGVGGGLVFNNELYRGEGYVAGEIGHMPMEDKTLEFFIGNAHLQARAAKLFKNKDIQLEEIYDLAQVGNSLAIEFWKDAGEYLGINLVGIVNLLNPRLIVIGGGVSNSFKFIAPQIRKTIIKRAMKVQSGMVKVVRAKLGNDAGIIGAQILVKDSLN